MPHRRPELFGGPPTLRALADTLEARRTASPEVSHTARLLSDRNLRLKKLGEEAVELAVACADGEVGRVRDEAADLNYHVLVACLGAGVGVVEVLSVLAERSEGEYLPVSRAVARVPYKSAP